MFALGGGAVVPPAEEEPPREDMISSGTSTVGMMHNTGGWFERSAELQTEDDDMS